MLPTCWQVSQRYGFSPLCVLLCRSIWYFWIKRMLHWSQLKGFSPAKNKHRQCYCVTLIKYLQTDKLLNNEGVYTKKKEETHHCGSSHAAGAGTSEWSSCYTDCTGKASHLCDQEYNHPLTTLIYTQPVTKLCPLNGHNNKEPLALCQTPGAWLQIPTVDTPPADVGEAALPSFNDIKLIYSILFSYINNLFHIWKLYFMYKKSSKMVGFSLNNLWVQRNMWQIPSKEND